MVLSSAMCTHAFGVCSVPAACASRSPGMATASISPPEAMAVVLRKSRREAEVALVFMASSSGLADHGGGILDGRLDAPVRAAAAQVAAHGFVDLLVARIRVLREQRRGTHQLPGLAIAALGHVVLDPRDLQRVRVVARKAFDRGDLAARH